MNANQIINMIMRLVMRRVINGGINAGMKRMSRGRGQQPAPRTHAQPPAEMGPHEAEMRRKQAAKRAAKAAARSNGQ